MVISMKSKQIIALVLILLTLLSFSGCGKKSPTEPAASEPVPDHSIVYEVINDQDYGTDLRNHSFRVVVTADASDDQLLWVFGKLDNKKWRDVTVWFYKDKAAVEAGDPYDVAMIKRAGSGEPEITR